jgi:hypothetical protein
VRVLLLLALAMQTGFAGGPTSRPVMLYLQAEQELPPAVMESLRSELESIMRPIGMRFEWRTMAENTGSEVSEQLAVVTLKGRCDASDLPVHSNSPGALGWTHVSDGVILPFTDLDCSGMRSFLGEQLSMLPRAHREEAFGRALGRVLAHELYHIFANTTRHAEGGVGKPVYSVEDLLSTAFRFGRREELAFRTH